MTFTLKTVLIAGISSLIITSCQTPSSPADSNETSTEKVVETPVEKSEPKVLVAMINSDTILSNYILAENLREKLNAQSDKYERILRGKETTLRNDMQKLQAEAATLSQFEGQARQRKLYEQQEELQIKQEEYSRKLLALEQEYNKEIDVALNDFLSRYCEDKPYKMVLSDSELGIIRWVDESLDITQEVLAGLNSEYELDNPVQAE